MSSFTTPSITANTPTTLVGLLDKSISEISKKGMLTLHRNLSPDAQTGHVMNDLRSSTLLSAGQLCDDKCIVVLNKYKVHVYKENTVVLSGDRNAKDGLWDIQLPVVHLPKPTNHLPWDNLPTYLQTLT